MLDTDSNESSTEAAKPRYENFIQGETIDLCIPSALAIAEDGWHSWFNSTHSLSFTGHGIFPNTAEQQHAILKDCTKSDRLVLLICRKDDQRAIGVVSLQHIDMSFRKAEIAIMIGAPERLPMASLSSLEAMALITAHGIQEMGLHRIQAGQVYPGLAGWNKLLELIGYKAEGFFKEGFRRGHSFSDVVSIAIVHSDFERLLVYREQLWPGVSTIKQLLRIQPKISYAAKLFEAHNDLQNEHFSFLYQ